MPETSPAPGRSRWVPSARNESPSCAGRESTLGDTSDRHDGDVVLVVVHHVGEWHLLCLYVVTEVHARQLDRDVIAFVLHCNSIVIATRGTSSPFTGRDGGPRQLRRGPLVPPPPSASRATVSIAVGFDQTVAVQNERLLRRQRDAARRDVRSGARRAERRTQAVRKEPSRAVAADQEGWRMTRVGEHDVASCRPDHGVEDRGQPVVDRREERAQVRHDRGRRGASRRPLPDGLLQGLLPAELPAPRVRRHRPRRRRHPCPVVRSHRASHRLPL